MINKSSTICFAFDRLIISNPLSRKRVKVDKYTCAKMILQKNLDLDVPTDTSNVELTYSKDEDDLQHWEKRNWSISLCYYLWSRIGHLYDKGENYKDLQKERVKSYVQSEGLPKDKSTLSDSAISLDVNDIDLPIINLNTVLVARGSVMVTPMRTVSKKTLSSILWDGLSRVRENRKDSIENNPLYALDSFGIGFDFYLCIYSVDGLENGIYFYDVEHHKLDLVEYMEEKALRTKMYLIQVEQSTCNKSSFAIIITANFARYQWRYRHEAALKYLYINCGQVAHNPILVTTAHGYKTHISPAIMDSLAMNLLKLDGSSYQAMYILSVG